MEKQQQKADKHRPVAPVDFRHWNTGLFDQKSMHKVSPKCKFAVEGTMVSGSSQQVAGLLQGRPGQEQGPDWGPEAVRWGFLGQAGLVETRLTMECWLQVQSLHSTSVSQTHFDEPKPRINSRAICPLIAVSDQTKSFGAAKLEPLAPTC